MSHAEAGKLVELATTGLEPERFFHLGLKGAFCSSEQLKEPGCAILWLLGTVEWGCVSVCLLYLLGSLRSLASPGFHLSCQLVGQAAGVSQPAMAQGPSTAALPMSQPPVQLTSSITVPSFLVTWKDFCSYIRSLCRQNCISCGS